MSSKKDKMFQQQGNISTISGYQVEFTMTFHSKPVLFQDNHYYLSHKLVCAIMNHLSRLHFGSHLYTLDSANNIYKLVTSEIKNTKLVGFKRVTFMFTMSVFQSKQDSHYQ